ncbi:hypothetical protein LUZ60_002364 [Juncus effusus]|nr:hypothetical protein LUZ60_002364 [Juncus effusus]
MELLSTLSVPVLSAAIGGVLALIFLADYFRRRRADVAAISHPDQAPAVAQSKPPKKNPQRAHAHHHHSDKDANKKHHPLDLNTLKGHTDSVTALNFSPDSHNLATVCADGAIRIFRIDDTSSKSFKSLKINLHAGIHPAGVVFSEGSKSVVVAGQALLGSSLYSYGDVSGKKPTNGNPPAHPEIQWQHQKVHGKENVLNLCCAEAKYGNGDGSTVVVSCSEETEIKVWDGKMGKLLGTVDTNQLKNNMAVISPNGRFLAAAAFTADVKVWEIIYSKDSSVKEIVKVMQLKGHKSAVTSLCFAPNSEQVLTASKDGTIRIWNINVRYHMDEDPKTLKVFNIPLKDAKGQFCNYDQMSISPNGKVLAVTSGPTLQWLNVETGLVLDTAEKVHEGDITGIAWAPRPIPNGGVPSSILATASADRKVKLWLAPSVNSS